jgi:hypothetical protein
MLAFNWNYAQTQDSSGAQTPSFLLSLPDVSVFVLSEQLRSGKLYRCTVCQRPWHLDGDGYMMSCVQEERVPLIQSWNEAEIWLGPEVAKKLDAIGRTPPDVYGNGRQYFRTPCGVLTKAGERIDLAIVSLQHQVPFEPYMRYRLGSEITDVYASPFALPLPVRVATSKAREAGQGFAPTPIEMPGGRAFVLNCQPEFLVQDGCRASEARLLGHYPEHSRKADVISRPDDVTYFIADG